MENGRATELVLIRHAPAMTGGRLCGRTDVPAALPDDAAISPMRAAFPAPDHVWVSPALRCRQTLDALWPWAEPIEEPAFWEQDFGDWDGLPQAEVPDIGNLSSRELAAYRPPRGESFGDLCQRVAPALLRAAAMPGQVVIVAHAGVVRAALALAIGNAAAAIHFEVAPLSATVLRPLPHGGFTVISVNWTPA